MAPHLVTHRTMHRCKCGKLLHCLQFLHTNVPFTNVNAEWDSLVVTMQC